MKNLVFIFLLFVSVACMAQVPTITTFPPNTTTAPGFSGATATTMTINGTNFTGATAVSFGGTPATSFTVVSSTQITAVVGIGTTGSVSVTTPGGTATRTGFTYLPLSRIITDFGGYWSSTTASANTTNPDDSHNLLGFNYGNTFYSTGANDATLTSNGVSFTAGNYRALPVAGIIGSSLVSGSVYIAAAARVDGNAGIGFVAGVSALTIKNALTDGIRGLNIGTGVTNLPSSAILNFKIQSIDITKIADAEPDLLITQIAAPDIGNDIFQFIDSIGTVVGTPVTQDMTLLTSFGNYTLDLFSFTANTPYSNAVPTGTFASNTTRPIRVVAFKLSDFSIDVNNVANIRSLRVTPSGISDYAFIAYNANSINIPPNISQNNGTTVSNVCNNGTAVLSVVGTAGTGGTLSYTWEQSTNGGTVWSAITNGGNFSGATTTNLSVINPVNGHRYRATVTESTNVNTNTSSVFTLTVSVPSVGGTVNSNATVCAGTNSTALTLTGNTGNVVRWEFSTNNFTNNTTVANTTTSLTAANLTVTRQYRAIVLNGACTDATSSLVTITVTPVGGGTIAGGTSVCTGTNSTTLTLSGHSGGVVSWESSENGFGSVTTISNTTTSLTVTNLTASTQYRAVAKNGVCPSANSSIATITVNPNGQWIGGATGNWNNAANWCGGIPTTPVNVSIPAGSLVTVSVVDAYANNITIAPGGSLELNGTGNLIVTSGATFTNNGTFNASASTTGKVSFSGTSTIAGTTTFKNIETYGALNVGSATTITGNFFLQSGGSLTGNSPLYSCPGSALIYNTGSVYVRGLEWTSATSGAGYPSNVYVQNNTTLNFPVVGPGYVCNDLIIDNGSALNQNYLGGSAPLTVARDVIITGNLALGALEGGDISLGRDWTRSAGGVFSHNNRTVNFTGSNNAVITAPILTISRDVNGAFGGETFYKLSINKSDAANTVTLGSHISVIKELQLLKGAFDLLNSNVTVVSKDSVTAAIAALPTSAGVINGVAINYSGTGKFIVQRHLAMGGTSVARRWRLVSAPLSSVGAPTINEAWQSGVSNSDKNAPIDPWPGFGTTITKSTTYNAADGYDQGSTNNPSLYYPGTNASGFNWSILASTLMPITNYEGYFLFARGSRNIVVSTPAINSNPTILEPKGRINTGTITKSFIADKQIIGNPYASAISFNNLVFTGYQNGAVTYNNVTPAAVGGIGLTYYLWDPKTSGSVNVGKWISCSSNGNGTYLVTANTSGLPVDGTIQSGAAFMMLAEQAAGTLTFKETDKLQTSSAIGIASRGTGSTDDIASLYSTLLVGTGLTAAISEGVINSYASIYHNEVDGQDSKAISSFNSTDALRILSQTKSLSIERRSKIAFNDTIFLQLLNVSRKTYSLQFKPINMEATIIATLEDKFKGTATPISMYDTTSVVFDVTADAKSSAADRFQIVFKTAGVLPITFSNLKAFKQGDNIAVQWNVDNELNVKTYEVQKSANGRAFLKVSSITAVANANSNNNSYSYVDTKRFMGDNFYRIKSIYADGSFEYSKIVNVAIASVKPTISVYPNPVQNSTIGLRLANVAAGEYQFALINVFGQPVIKSTIQYAGGNTGLTLKTSQYLSSGNYQLEITGPDGFRQTLKLQVLSK